MQTVYQTKRYSARGWMHRVNLTADGQFSIFYKHRSARNYAGTFKFSTLELAVARLNAEY